MNNRYDWNRICRIGFKDRSWQETSAVIVNAAEGTQQEFARSVDGYDFEIRNRIQAKAVLMFNELCFLFLHCVLREILKGHYGEREHTAHQMLGELNHYLREHHYFHEFSYYQFSELDDELWNVMLELNFEESRSKGIDDSLITAMRACFGGYLNECGFWGEVDFGQGFMDLFAAVIESQLKGFIGEMLHEHRQVIELPVAMLIRDYRITARDLTPTHTEEVIWDGLLHQHLRSA